MPVAVLRAELVARAAGVRVGNEAEQLSELIHLEGPSHRSNVTTYVHDVADQAQEYPSYMMAPKYDWGQEPKKRKASADLVVQPTAAGGASRPATGLQQQREQRRSPNQVRNGDSFHRQLVDGLLGMDPTQRKDRLRELAAVFVHCDFRQVHASFP